MDPAEKLYCARCMTIAGVLLAVALLIIIADSYSGMWFAEVGREFASSLELASGNLDGR